MTTASPAVRFTVTVAFEKATTPADGALAAAVGTEAVGVAAEVLVEAAGAVVPVLVVGPVEVLLALPVALLCAVVVPLCDEVVPLCAVVALPADCPEAVDDAVLAVEVSDVVVLVAESVPLDCVEPTEHPPSTTLTMRVARTKNALKFVECKIETSFKAGD